MERATTYFVRFAPSSTTRALWFIRGRDGLALQRNASNRIASLSLWYPINNPNNNLLTRLLLDLCPIKFAARFEKEGGTLESMSRRKGVTKKKKKSCHVTSNIHIRASFKKIRGREEGMEHVSISIE